MTNTIKISHSERASGRGGKATRRYLSLEQLGSNHAFIEQISYHSCIPGTFKDSYLQTYGGHPSESLDQVTVLWHMSTSVRKSSIFPSVKMFTERCSAAWTKGRHPLHTKFILQQLDYRVTWPLNHTGIQTLKCKMSWLYARGKLPYKAGQQDLLALFTREFQKDFYTTTLGKLSLL